MAKKYVLILILVFFTAGAVFSQTNFTLSAGGGGFFTSDFGGGFELDDIFMKTPFYGGGIFGFFDATYGEFSIGGFYGGGTYTYKDPNNPDKPIISWKKNYSKMGVEFTLLLKYPFDVTNQITLFPLFGGSYQLIVVADVDFPQSPVRPQDLNSFWLPKGGVGVDYFFNNNLFLRGTLLYGLRLPNEFENNFIKNNPGSKYLNGHGLTARISVGYRFGRISTPAPRQNNSTNTTAVRAQSAPTPANTSYNVTLNDQKYGPYDMEQLRQMVQRGTLTRDTLVWREGMVQWVPAGTIRELLPLFGNNPPPSPTESKYYVGISYGSYDMEQLRQMVQQGTLTRNTLIWREGMSQWVPAGTIQELSSIFENNPPSLPPPRRN
jgi:hypothetical protein